MAVELLPRLNQYTSAGPAVFGYDPNGNLTSDGAVTFIYDVENRLVKASGAKNAELGTSKNLSHLSV